MEGELDIPFMVVANFMVRAWQLVGGCRFCLNGEGGWNLPLCKKTQPHGVIDSSLKLNDDISFHHLIQLTVTQQYHSCLYVKSIIMVSVGQSSIHTMTRTSSLWATGSLTMYNESFRVLLISRNLRTFTSLYLMYLSPFIHPLFQLIRDNTLDRLSLL